MSEWIYQLTPVVALGLVDNPAADYVSDATLSTDEALCLVDTEVHRLTELIKKTENDIYKLRKWQRVLKQKAKGDKE